MAGYGFQVVIDSKDPHAQADWWAAALGWQVESSDEDFIRQMIDSGYASRDDTTEWKGVLVWREGAAINDVDHPDRPRVLFQRVPEEKVVKNRVHLDVASNLIPPGRRDISGHTSPTVDQVVPGRPLGRSRS
jgi:hypothetical protein